MNATVAAVVTSPTAAWIITAACVALVVITAVLCCVAERDLDHAHQRIRRLRDLAARRGEQLAELREDLTAAELALEDTRRAQADLRDRLRQLEQLLADAPIPLIPAQPAVDDVFDDLMHANFIGTDEES